VSKFVEKLKKAMEKEKEQKFVKNLRKILEHKKDDLHSFYELYGEFIQENRDFALSSCYYLFRGDASKILTVEELLAMDENLLNTYAFKEPERLLISFKGRIKGLSGPLEGVLFLTNYRILGTGEMKGRSLPTRILEGAEVSMVKDINAMMKTLGEEAFSEGILEQQFRLFPHNFPIINTYNINKTSYAINYEIQFEYQKRSKTKVKEFFVIIIPVKEEGEKSKEFKTRKKVILDKLEETLLKAQIK
jgi:hypothetical protein